MRCGVVLANHSQSLQPCLAGIPMNSLTVLAMRPFSSLRPAGQTDFTLLGPDVVDKVVSYLGAQSRSNAQAVNKTLRDAVPSRRTWYPLIDMPDLVATMYGGRVVGPPILLATPAVDVQFEFINPASGEEGRWVMQWRGSYGRARVRVILMQRNDRVKFTKALFAVQRRQPYVCKLKGGGSSFDLY